MNFGPAAQMVVSTRFTESSSWKIIETFESTNYEFTNFKIILRGHRSIKTNNISDLYKLTYLTIPSAKTDYFY